MKKRKAKKWAKKVGKLLKQKYLPDARDRLFWSLLRDDIYVTLRGDVVDPVTNAIKDREVPKFKNTDKIQDQ